MPEASPTPLLAEDLLLLLFDERAGWFRGEGSFLSRTLAGAALAELALHGHLEIGRRRPAARQRVRAIPGRRPSDPLLAAVWARVGQAPINLRALADDLGHPIRTELVDRVVEAGFLQRERSQWFGLIPVPRLSTGRTDRRSDVIAGVRAVLVDGVDPEVRTGILAALLSASEALPSLDPEIPWSSGVFLRGKAIQAGRWSGGPVDDRVARAITAVRAGQQSGTSPSPIVRAS